MRTSSPDLTAGVLGEYCFCGEEAMDALTQTEERPTFNVDISISMWSTTANKHVFIRKIRGPKIHLRSCSELDPTAWLESRSKESILHVK